jgi:hypothetical protein
MGTTTQIRSSNPRADAGRPIIIHQVWGRHNTITGPNDDSSAPEGMEGVHDDDPRSEQRRAHDPSARPTTQAGEPSP